MLARFGPGEQQVLGDGRGAQRILAALDAAGDLAPALEQEDRALLLAAWIEASTG